MTESTFSSQRKREIMDSLNEFYSKEDNFYALTEILTKQKRLSLRTLEFAASHSHKFQRGLKLHGVYQNYLDSNGKKYFDAFRRHQKFSYELNGKEVESNVAQLRFIKFALENGVVNWLSSPTNVDSVEREMKRHINSRKKGKKRKKVFSPAVSEEGVKLTI